MNPRALFEAPAISQSAELPAGIFPYGRILHLVRARLHPPQHRAVSPLSMNFILD
jgi:hypothetical protein